MRYPVRSSSPSTWGMSSRTARRGWSLTFTTMPNRIGQRSIMANRHGRVGFATFPGWHGSRHTPISLSQHLLAMLSCRVFQKVSVDSRSSTPHTLPHSIKLCETMLYLSQCIDLSLSTPHSMLRYLQGCNPVCYNCSNVMLPKWHGIKHCVIRLSHSATAG